MANSKKALDENGVLYLWGKVKTYVATAIANIKLPSKTSDLTNDSGFITAKDVLAGTVDLTAYMLASDLVAITNTELDDICK